MGEWSNLTQREKSNIIRFAIKNGVSDINTIRDTFNVYAGGNGHIHEGTQSDSHLHVPTKEEYITQKLDSIRADALSRSRAKTPKQTTIVTPQMVYGKGFTPSEYNRTEEWLEYAKKELKRLESQESFRLTKALKNTPEFASPSVNNDFESTQLANYRRTVADTERILEKMKKGDYVSDMDLDNCIANLAEFFPHGLPYGNQTFSKNPGKWGFSLIDTWNVEPGDIVQSLTNDYGRGPLYPHHAMIYNDVDNEGKHTFNYSNGSSPVYNKETGEYLGGGYGVGKTYPDAVSNDGEHLFDVNVYRYTGTPQDSIMWINEWLQKYNNKGTEFSKGGKIFIKPSKRGTFTVAATKHGKSVQEFARQVLANKENYSPAMVRKANFARNSAKWHKHEDGGDNNAEYSIIDYLRDLRNLLNIKEEDRLTSNISLSPAFYNKSVELASSPLYKPVLKGIAKKAMHQSSYPTRSIENFKKAIFEPDTYKYTGGVDYYSGGWDNRKRDLVSLFINGKPDRGSDLQSLEGEDSRGFDYGDFIATHYPNKTIKTYEGIFPLRGTIQVSPSGYELAKFLGSNLSNIGHYKNAGSAPSASDNVASYRTHYNVWKGEPELIQTDLWDFGGDYNNTWNSKNSDFKRLQSEVVNTIGTPFILKSINPIRVSSTPDEEFENQTVREADAANVLRYDSDSDTYNTLLSLPELTVGRLRNFMFEEGERATTFSTGGPLYPFSFSKNPYWKTPVVRYAEGGDTNRELEFIPNENIQNVEVWLNKGTKFQKRRPGTVNLQNIVDALDPNGPDNQYVWDDAEHNSYSAFRRNPDYRAQIVPAINKGITPIGLSVSKYIEKAPGVHLSPEYILNNLPNFKIPQVSMPLPKRNNQNLNGNWIQQDSMWNPAYGYETFHLENSPYYGIKYYSIPGAVNAGQGSSAVLDSTVMGIPIQELNNRIFDYRTKNGGWNSFSDVN